MRSNQSRRLHKLRVTRGAPTIFSAKHLQAVAAFLLLSLSAALVFSLFPPRSVGGAATYNVTIVNYSFRPHIINITTGTNVIWTFATNGSDVNDIHTVTSKNLTQSGSYIFASPVLHSGQTFNFTFYSPGRYPYFCSVHPSIMNAIANVTGQPITPPPPPTTQTPAPQAGNSLPFYAGVGAAVILVALAGVGLYIRRTRRVASPYRNG